MNPEEKFLETLKKLGFPGVNKYSATNFESYFSDPELQPFAEYFCTLDENNVLTSEELEEFASITPQEMKELEELAASDTELLNQDKDAVIKEEAEFLTERLNHLERKHSLLEEQKRTLLLHKDVILTEKTECESAHKDLRRLFDDLSMNKVPQSLAQLSAALETVSDLISKLKDLSDNTGDENAILPFLSTKDVLEYFTEEEKLGQHVMIDLLQDIQFEDEGRTKLSIPGLPTQEIAREILMLGKFLMTSKINESRSICDWVKAKKNALLVEKYQSGYFDYILQMSNAQLSNKSAEATELNETLTKKEVLLLSHLSNAISERVDAQCRQIAISHSHETRQVYKDSLEKISLPLQYLVNQRARLELLNLVLNIHQKHWQDTKCSLNEIFGFACAEKEICHLKQQKLEECMKQTEVDYASLKPDSIFFSAHKVLCDVDNQEQSSVSLSNVVKGIEKLSDRKELTSKIEEENKNVIKMLEKQYLDLEKVVSNGAGYDEFKKAENNFSTKINQVEILLQDMSNILKESEREWQQKNKLLASNRNLKLARNLFIYALLERETFERIIENIEEVAQHFA